MIKYPPFDYSTPFTLAELFEFYHLGPVNDPSRSRKVVAELVRKGYSQKVRGVPKKRYWAKWDVAPPFVMPDIP